MNLLRNAFLSCAFALPAAAAFGDANEATVSCTAKIEQDTSIQVGQVVPVRVMALSQEPIDTLEVNGVSVVISTKNPDQLFVSSQQVRLSVAGEATVHVRVGSNGVYADCETPPIVVEALPTCGASQTPVQQTVVRELTKYELVPVRTQYAQTEVICQNNAR